MGAGKVVFHFTNTPERREEGKLEEVELVFETGDDRRNGLPLVPGTDCINYHDIAIPSDTLKLAKIVIATHQTMVRFRYVQR